MEKMLIILTTLLLMSCCGQQPPIPDPPDIPKDTIFELVWQNRLDSLKLLLVQTMFKYGIIIFYVQVTMLTDLL